MTTQDFERLKAICEKEGFTIESYSGGKTAIVGVKDIWEGVEFAECINQYKHYVAGKIYNIKTSPELLLIKDCEGYYISSKVFKPSTETAYVEKLKKEAFERFGEIKEGDMFNTGYGRGKIINGHPKWFYNKHIDFLYYNGLIIYSKGKWAERVKERVKVEFFQDSLDEHNKIEEWGYVFRIHNYRYGCEKSIESGQFLAKQLEVYLNNEIK